MITQGTHKVSTSDTTAGVAVIDPGHVSAMGEATCLSSGRGPAPTPIEQQLTRAAERRGRKGRTPAIARKKQVCVLPVSVDDAGRLRIRCAHLNEGDIIRWLSDDGM